MKGLVINTTTIIILFLALIAIFIVASGALNSVLEKFGIIKDKPLQPISINDENKIKVECEEGVGGSQNLYGYKISLVNANLRFEGPSEVVPVFMFKGRTGIANAIRFEEFEAQGTIASSIIKSEIPPSGKQETFTLLFMKRDTNCINIAGNSVPVEEFVEKCASRVQGQVSLATSVVKLSDCTFKKPSEEKEGYITLDKTEVFRNDYCKIKFTIRNKDDAEWKKSDKVKARLWCLGDVGSVYVPPLIDDFVELRPGAPKTFDVFGIYNKLCVRWNEDVLKDADLRKKYGNGWRIDLFKGCDDSVSSIFGNSACCNFKDADRALCRKGTYNEVGSEPTLISSITFRC